MKVLKSRQILKITGANITKCGDKFILTAGSLNRAGFFLFLRMEDFFKNKVAESGIQTLDLADYFSKEEIILFDMKDYLFMGLILKEKDFRESLKALDKTIYKDKIATITCTADAIIPMWAYMLAASALEPIAKEILFAGETEAKNKLLLKNINGISVNDFADKRIVVKGCGELPIPEEAYVEITKMLRPVVKSIMYGEPCSTVPVFKKEKISGVIKFSEQKED